MKNLNVLKRGLDVKQSKRSIMKIIDLELYNVANCYVKCLAFRVSNINCSVSNKTK